MRKFGKMVRAEIGRIDQRCIPRKMKMKELNEFL
jgi:hypothetical protein